MHSTPFRLSYSFLTTLSDTTHSVPLCHIPSHAPPSHSPHASHGNLRSAQLGLNHHTCCFSQAYVTGYYRPASHWVVSMIVSTHRRLVPVVSSNLLYEATEVYRCLVCALVVTRQIVSVVTLLGSQ
eukprot:Blabericola_migrator_1__6358@NODE_3206_length_1949_cov_35_914453_g2006_i0_p1_GENE_NODE_3206_length_1949_cov_35_914453_g2006_i0NODE_3206_length_1949_cov_35_914453_g2006_i0_p1_ORF_typecomplete_len126_score8_27_NODE_3206_length_1949_cov_35_914453_g2006_i09001277